MKKKKIITLLTIILCLTLTNTNKANAKTITLNKWQPTHITNYPTKKEYTMGEKINTNGLRINFEKYTKNGNKVKKEEKQLQIMPYQIINGWEMILLTPYATKNTVEIKLRLINPKASFDGLYPETVNIDNTLNII